MTAPFLRIRPPLTTPPSARDGGGERDDPDDEQRRRVAPALAVALMDDEQRFREALADQGPALVARAEPDVAQTHDGTQGEPRYAALKNHAPGPDARRPAMPGADAAPSGRAAPSQAASLQYISARISQVMIDDTPGRRVLRARLHEYVAPGVTLSLHEVGQTLMIRLTCRHAIAFNEMATLRYALASRLAARLGQRVHVWVALEARPGAELEAVADAAPAGPAP